MGVPKPINIINHTSIEKSSLIGVPQPTTADLRKIKTNEQTGYRMIGFQITRFLRDNQHLHVLYVVTTIHTTFYWNLPNTYFLQFNQSPIQTGHLDSVKGDHFTEMKIAVLNWKKFETLTTDCRIQSESLIRCCLIQAPLIQQLSQMLNRSDCLMEVKITVLKAGGGGGILGL